MGGGRAPIAIKRTEIVTPLTRISLHCQRGQWKRERERERERGRERQRTADASEGEEK
jgi:hypothetical protein